MTIVFRAQCIFTALVLAGCGGSAAVTPGQAFQNAPDNTAAVHKTSRALGGSFTEFPLPPGQSGASSVAVDRTGIPWVLTRFAIDRVGNDGHVTTFPMPSNVTGLYGGIAWGVDGALWFLGNVPNSSYPTGAIDSTRVYRLTTKGKLTSYPLALGVSQSGNLPEDITSGIDGKLWFTIDTGAPDLPCQVYGAISTQGVVGPLIPACDTKGVTTGPDGNMWVAFGGLDPGAEQEVVSFSAQANMVGSFTLPMSSNPEGIATGPDHNLWITLVGLNAIVRLTTAGVVTTYPLAIANSLGSSFMAQEARIVSGRNAMWFVQTGSNNIGRITMSGMITEYAVPTPDSGATGLAFSPASGWFVLAGSVLENGSAVPSVAAVIPKVQTRAAKIDFALPTFADTSNYWVDTTKEKAKAALIACNLPVVTPTPSPTPIPTPF
jgi:virginiamycin B lyase